MPRVGHDAQVGFGPGFVQVPGALHRADDVVAALHDRRGQVADARHVVEQLRRGAQEAAVDEVVALDAREGVGGGVVLELRQVVGVEAQEAGRALPGRPRTRGGAAHGGVFARQPAVVGAHHIAAFGGRDRRDEAFVEVGVERAGAVGRAVEPGELPGAHQKYPAQHELGDARRMRLRIGERERRAPGAAEQLPALDAEVLAQPLHVLDQMPGGVVDQAGVRTALAAAALVEEHDAVARRVEETPHPRVGAAARAAVQEHHRFAARVAAFLPVDLVQRRDAQHAAAVRVDRGVEAAQRAGGRRRCRHGAVTGRASGRGARRRRGAHAGGRPPARRARGS